MLLPIGVDDCLLESLKSFAGDLKRIGTDEGVIRCRDFKCFIRSELLIGALIRGETVIVTNLLPAVDACSRETKVPINAIDLNVRETPLTPVLALIPLLLRLM